MTTKLATQPKRIQRRRVKGWKMPPNTVYVGRPTIWGNPFRVGGGMSAEQAVGKFSLYVYKQHQRWWLDVGRSTYAVAELRGKDLACWCPLDQPCHADVLLEIANSEVEESR